MIQYFPIVTGSLTVLGNINVSGSITTSGSITISGSITSASFASTASFVALAQSASNAVSAATASFVANAESASYVLTAQTASFVALAQSASNAVAAQTASFVANAQTASYVLNAVSSSFASTASFVALAQSASNAVSAVTASFANNLTVAGTLTAQTLVVQTITSSVDFVTGSTRFGSILANTHVFTGSVLMTGSLTVGGTVQSQTLSGYTHVDIGNPSTGGALLFSNGGGTSYGYINGASSGLNLRSVVGDLTFNVGSTERMRISGSNVGIGTTSPSSFLSLYTASTNADVNYIKIEMPSWGGSINYKKNIIWHDGGNVVGGIGMSFTSPYTYMDFHSFYNSVPTTGSLMRIQGNGYVGIGTTSPSDKLTVDAVSGNVVAASFFNSSMTANQSSYIEIGKNYSSTYNTGELAFKYVGDGSSSNIVSLGFYGAGNKLNVLGGGNVGIGTTSATSSYGFSRSLVVSNPANSEISLAATTSGKVLSMGVTDGMNYFQTTSGNGYNFQTGGTSRVTIESGGKVVAPYGYQSFKGSITLTSGNTGTIYTMAGDGVYYVYSRFYGAAAIFMASAIVSSLSTNGESFISNTRTGANIAITVSGNNIQVTNGGYGTYTFQWSILYQSVDF